MLSICVNVKNGERYLSRCLNSLSRFDDVVLLDNFSTDKTIEIAKLFSNVRIFQSPFDGMGNVRNLAASYARNDWLMFVDCDEVLSYELVEYLLSCTYVDNVVYKLTRINYFDGRLVDSSAWENDKVIRIYNRKQTNYSAHEVHESVVTKDKTIMDVPNGLIYHFPYSQVSELVSKTQSYSTWYARQNYKKKYPQLWLIPFRMFFMFIKCFILKKGFKDGYEGFVVSIFNSIGVLTKYLKLYEMYYKKEITLACNVKNQNEIDDISKLINLQILLPSLVLFVCENYEEGFKSTCVVDYKILNTFDARKVCDDILKPSIENSNHLINCDNTKIHDKYYIYNIRKKLQEI